MNNFQYVEALLSSLPRQLAAAHPSHLDGEGHADIDFENRTFTLTLSHDWQTLSIRAPLIPLPKGRVEFLVLCELLACNYHWGAAGAGVLGLEHALGWVYMVRKFPIEKISKNTFCDYFRLMRCQIKYWSSLVRFLEQEEQADLTLRH